MNILCIGDIVSAIGISTLKKHLSSIKKDYKIDFTIANGENACGVGIGPAEAEAIYMAGVDVITLGNHTYRNKAIKPFLDDTPYILRPANFAPQAPGRGDGVFDAGGKTVRVVNLIGRCFMDFGPDNPFLLAEKLFSESAADLTIVDFHAQATSEKEAMGFHLDGRITAIFGTHTHVQTADEKILPGGTGYISDVGMTGAYHSVLGVEPAHSVAMFRGDMPPRLESASGAGYLCGAVFEADEKTGRCLSVKRIQVMD